MRILFTGGGTAGHIFPIIAVAKELKKSYPNIRFDFFYIGPKDRFIDELLAQEGIAVKKILAGKIRRYFSFQNIIDVLFKIPISIIQAFYFVFTISPDLIFSKGGYGALPAVFSGWLLMTPVFLHESDAAPGLANKISNNFCIQVFTAFSKEKTEFFPNKKMFSVGNPIREGILNGSKERAFNYFKLTGEKPVVLIFGGSQGARRINEQILLGLNDFLSKFEIIHQTGRLNFKQVRAESEVVVKQNLKKYYHPAPFLNENEMADAYKAADLVISRAGAGSIFELAALGKPSILVPLPDSAQDHQVKNAYVYSRAGASIVLEEPNFTPHFALERMEHILSSPKEMELMSKKAKEFARPQAAKIIADLLVAYLKR